MPLHWHSKHFFSRKPSGLTWTVELKDDPCPSVMRILIVEVEPEHRRQGIATRMLSELERAGYDVEHDREHARRRVGLGPKCRLQASTMTAEAHTVPTPVPTPVPPRELKMAVCRCVRIQAGPSGSSGLFPGTV